MSLGPPVAWPVSAVSVGGPLLGTLHSEAVEEETSVSEGVLVNGGERQGASSLSSMQTA